MSLVIVSRSESGLPVPTTAALDDEAHSLVLHHWGSFAPTTNARVRFLRALHLQRISSVGEAYNWLVGHDAPGKAWELRGRGRRPGGQRNVNGFDNNAGTRSIVVNGHYGSNSKADPTGPIDGDLIETIAQLVVREHLAGDMPSQITHGHTNYVRPDGKGCCQSTSCPGDRLLEAIPTINKRIRQLLEEPDMTPEQEAKLDRVLEIVGRIPESVDDPFHDGRPSFATLLRRIYLNARSGYRKSSQALTLLEEFAKNSGLSEATIQRIAEEAGEAAAGEIGERLAG